MATQTVQIIDFDGGAVTWEYDWSDVSLRLLQARCTNDCTGLQHRDENGTPRRYATKMTIISQTTGDRLEQVVYPSGATTRLDGSPLPDGAVVGAWTFNIPTGQANRFGLSLDGRGRLLGIDHAFEHNPNIG